MGTLTKPLILAFVFICLASCSALNGNVSQSTADRKLAWLQSTLSAKCAVGLGSSEYLTAVKSNDGIVLESSEGSFENVLLTPSELSALSVYKVEQELKRLIVTASVELRDCVAAQSPLILSALESPSKEVAECAVTNFAAKQSRKVIGETVVARVLKGNGNVGSAIAEVRAPLGFEALEQVRLRKESCSHGKCYSHGPYKRVAADSSPVARMKLLIRGYNVNQLLFQFHPPGRFSGHLMAVATRSASPDERQAILKSCAK